MKWGILFSHEPTYEVAQAVVCQSVPYLEMGLYIEHKFIPLSNFKVFGTKKPHKVPTTPLQYHKIPIFYFTLVKQPIFLAPLLYSHSRNWGLVC